MKVAMICGLLLMIAVCHIQAESPGERNLHEEIFVDSLLKKRVVCEDDPEMPPDFCASYEHYCPFEIYHAFMATYCSATCGFC